MRVVFYTIFHIADHRTRLIANHTATILLLLILLHLAIKLINMKEFIKLLCLIFIFGILCVMNKMMR